MSPSNTGESLKYFTFSTMSVFQIDALMSAPVVRVVGAVYVAIFVCSC
jgi:hypothetical protein